MRLMVMVWTNLTDIRPVLLTQPLRVEWRTDSYVKVPMSR
jgi:hypothetical protein